MSEIEQLKKNAEDALRKQRGKELEAYIDQLEKTTEAAAAKARKASLVHMLACLGWIGTVFIQLEWVYSIGLFVFLGTLMYDQWCHRAFTNALSEYQGMHNTLKILGLIDCKCNDHGKKRRRRTASEFSEMVKGWFTQKKAAQDKVYAPA